MDMLLSLWLPIVITTVALFFASFLAWNVLPHHKPDLRTWPEEERLLQFIRDSGAPAGEYPFPMCTLEELKHEAGRQRLATGPWGMVNVWPAPPPMGRNMVMTVLFFLVVTVLVAYVGSVAVPAGATLAQVFQVVGVTAILAHSTGGICREIWFTRPLRAKLMDLIDGIAYGAITGLVFGLLWP